MSGSSAARGFEYQFLCTLSYALDGLLDKTENMVGVRVDSPSPDDIHGDQEIVDFSLHSDTSCLLAAQVKGGISGSTITATEAIRILLRLLTVTADRYAIITNRRAGKGLQALISIVDTHSVQATSIDNLRANVAELVSRSAEIYRAVLSADDTWFERLRQTTIVLDNRSKEDLYEVVRERVRIARHTLEPTSVGWDAAGLLTGYLISEVLAKAALEESAPLSRTDLANALCVDHDTLKSLMRYRDWSVNVTPAPRSADIARPELIKQIAAKMPTPVQGDAVPVCVLTGLSGIGKTSVATAWADDRADAYASVIWVEAATTAQLEASFATAAKWFSEGGGPRDGDSARDILFAALARTARPWLMVFDNAVSFKHVREWIPRRGNGHVLITTTDPIGISGSHVSKVTVDAMTKDEAVRLLTRRLSPQQSLTDADSAALQVLSEQLLKWPLALELAAAYLADCLDGIAGIETYRHLMMRSLSDEDAVPIGYPRPLVQTILLAWQRMCNAPLAADKLATIVLRYAAFVAPRQIPLHLMLGCYFLDPRQFADSDQDETRRAIHTYAGDDPPAGEIVRSLRRQSLVTPDTPLFNHTATGANGPETAGYTLSINEIVQTILRGEVNREGLLPSVLSGVSFHVQHWMSQFMDTDQFNLAFDISGHAITAAEHALELDVHDFSVALLLGNTAKILDLSDHPVEAVRYLRAELDILDQSDRPHDLIKMQTSAALAAAVLNSSIRPSEVSDIIADILQSCLRQVDSAIAENRQTTARTLRLALATTNNLMSDGGATERIKTIASTLEHYCEIVPLAGEIDFLHELSELNSLIKESRYYQALEKIDFLLASSCVSTIERPQLIRMQVECFTWLENWSAASEGGSHFVETAASDALRATDAAHFSRNLGIAAFAKIKEQHAEAVELFEMAITVADHIERNGHTMQLHDQALIAVFRAIKAFIYHDVSACREWLNHVNLDDLAVTDTPGIYATVYRLLMRWCTLSEKWPETAPGRSTESEVNHANESPNRSITEMELSSVLEFVKSTPRKRAPLMAVALAQLWRDNGRTRVNPTEASVELCRALELMGFTAEVIATRFTAESNTPADTEKPTTHIWPHHIVWSESFGRLVDPNVAHLHGFKKDSDHSAIPQAPVIAPLKCPNDLRSPREIGRPPYFFTYSIPAPAPGDSTENAAATNQRAKSGEPAFFLALETCMLVSTFGLEWAEKLERQHSQLEGLISPMASYIEPTSAPSSPNSKKHPGGEAPENDSNQQHSASKDHRHKGPRIESRQQRRARKRAEAKAASRPGPHSSLATAHTLAQGWPVGSGTTIRIANNDDADEIEQLAEMADVPLAAYIRAALRTGSLAGALRAGLQFGHQALIRDIASSSSKMANGDPRPLFLRSALPFVAERSGEGIVGTLLACPPADVITGYSGAAAADQLKQQQLALGATIMMTQIEVVAVAKHIQGLGIGKALVNRCVQIYRQCRFKLLYGKIPAEHDLESLFSRCGFEIKTPEEYLNLWVIFGIHGAIQADHDERLFEKWIS